MENDDRFTDASDDLHHSYRYYIHQSGDIASCTQPDKSMQAHFFCNAPTAARAARLITSASTSEYSICTIKALGLYLE